MMASKAAVRAKLDAAAETVINRLGRFHPRANSRSPRTQFWQDDGISCDRAKTGDPEQPQQDNPAFHTKTS